MHVALISTYELGHQPLALAAGAAALRGDGHEVTCIDLAVESPPAATLRDADLVAISIPMHTAARLGIAVAKRVREINPRARIAFYGLYALPLGEMLQRTGLADHIVGGEYEPGLRALAAGDRGNENAPLISFERQHFAIPDRSGLPPLAQYARYVDAEGMHLAGYAEASRGCAHLCTHCPITPVYGGRLRLVQAEVVLGDIEQLVAAGARHITFGDPDFFNAVPHSLAIAEEYHRRCPDLTFDATIKVEHLVEHADLLPRLRAMGCTFITSAFESTNDETLRLLDKGHTAAQMEDALSACRDAGIVVHPTWVPFTPWTKADDMAELVAFVERNGLVDLVQPVQYALRLLLPPGSALLEPLREQGLLGEFDDGALSYTWKNPDARLDELQQELLALVEDATSDCHDEPGEPAHVTFERVRDAICRVARPGEAPGGAVSPGTDPVAGLTEAWFCCAEPTATQLAPMEKALGV